ncbi:uncharacterized protein LOC129040574 isoform X2 [Pongo pygmaeus]|uniref:uncharacterized protein LOC129040574 isoform X2 n=1 Tax=Pongo pygmaeus TaxID=9600 RepID=UPI0023E0FA88|nr:uncharacterized protein LOC129040574 isoform X2 [Pongo pygmaeus]
MISKMRKQKLGYVSKHFQGPAANQWLTTSFLCLCCHPCHGLCQDSRRSLPSAPQLLCTNPECQTEGRRKEMMQLIADAEIQCPVPESPWILSTRGWTVGTISS